MVYCPNPVCPKPQNPDDASYCQTCGSGLILNETYRLESLLGQGGFGRTFLATRLTKASKTAQDKNSLDKNSLDKNSLCVVKQIYPDPIGLESASLESVGPESASLQTNNDSNFGAEAERLRRLGEHPQIPRLIEAIASKQGQFLVQEYAQGQNLQQQIEADGPWAEERVRSLLESLVNVLQYVHSFQIIHRDIKPANIVSPKLFNANVVDVNVVSSSNKATELPMLVDFGAAKSVRHSAAKTVIGSAGYAAPEQSMGQATFASDVYSLGLSCLYLLTGLHPFELYSAIEDLWVWRDYLPAPIEGRFAQVLDQMIQRSLQQRYESMEQVALDLQFSQNLLVRSSQEILTRAKESVPGLKQVLNLESSTALKRLWSASQRRLNKTAAPSAVATDAQSWQRQYRLAPKIGLVRSLSISPSGQVFASGGVDGAVRLWHLASGELIHSFARRLLVGTGHAAAITAMAFHPDGRALYSASEDGTMKEWDSTQRCLLNTMPTSGWLPTDLLVTPDGTQLISPNSDGQIVIWDIETLLPIERLTQHQKQVTAAVISPSGDLLVSGSDDGTVKLWQRQTVEGKGQFRLAKSLTITPQQSGKVGAAARPFQPSVALALQQSSRPSNQPSSQLSDYRLIVATAAEVLWYSVNEHLDISAPVSLYRSADLIKVIALSQDGYLAVGSEDRILTLWNLATGECVAKLAHDWGIEVIAFSPNSQTLITASTDEVISIWQRSNA